VPYLSASAVVIYYEEVIYIQSHILGSRSTP